jgi:hypothetical protein
LEWPTWARLAFVSRFTVCIRVLTSPQVLGGLLVCYSPIQSPQSSF